MNENQKSAIAEAAENEFKHCHSAVDEVSYRHGFNHGAQHVIEHPERYGLTSLRLDQPWPLRDILIKLEDATDALLTHYDFHHIYWEQIKAAHEEAKKILEELK